MKKINLVLGQNQPVLNNQKSISTGKTQNLVFLSQIEIKLRNYVTILSLVIFPSDASFGREISETF